jgi:type IV pilus assembly protein PilA
MHKLRQRLQREEGFTLIELLVVIVILGILLAIAVPSYLHFKDRANKSAAQSNVRTALPAVEAYYADHQTYASAPSDTPPGVFTPAGLKADYDSGINVEGVVSVASGAQYCISATSGDYRAKVTGPGGAIAVDKKSALGVC